MTRDKVTIHKWVADAMNDLPPDDYKKVMTGLFKYGYEGIRVKMGGGANAVYMALIDQLERNNIRYVNGCKGGRPRKESTK